MTRFTLLLLVVLLGGADRLAAQEKVEARGITSVIKLEEVTFGHLIELTVSSKCGPPNLRLPPGPTLERITILGPGFDIFFLASSPSLREALRRSIRLATIILRPGTSHIPPRTRQTSRFAF